MENPFTEETNKVQRPVFLTVLCILTFIGSGWGILGNLYSVFTFGDINTSVQIEKYTNMVGDMGQSGGGEFMESFLNSSIEAMQIQATHAREIAIINLVLNLISILGAVQMFYLRRPGFYLYVAAQVLLLFVTPYFTGFSMVVAMGMAAAAFVTLIFIILYAVNLKYLK